MIKQICLSWSDGREEGAIQVEVVYSARRTLGLEVKADGSVLARVPRRMPDQAVKEFVEERREWIVEKWFLMQDRRRAEEERGPRDYEGDPALERWYREQARKRIAWRTAYFARRMGVTYGQNQGGQLQRRGESELPLETDFNAAGNPGLRGGARAGPPEGDEPLRPLLGGGGAGIAGLPAEEGVA